MHGSARASKTFLALLLMTFIFVSSQSASSAETKVQSFDTFKASTLPRDILFKVLARNGKSKHFTDVIALDGGTVGIANFAVGGLADLYHNMNTQKYFGKPAEEMVRLYSASCRPPHRQGKDTGWGCFSQKWWKTGMEKFVRSPESETVQINAWLDMMEPTVKAALAHGWNDSRSLAIATGVANSVGAGGFRKLAERNGWRSEQVLTAYVNDAHRKRRQDAINAAFPR
ncbi:hypothetical protein ACQZ6A_18105 [Agrobacterium vitis]